MIRLRYLLIGFLLALPMAALAIQGVDLSSTNTGLTSDATNGQFFVGVTSGAPKFVTMSQDCTTTNAGVVTCLKTNNVAFAALATLGVGTGLTSSSGNANVSLSTASNSLGGNVALNNAANYFDGPSMAQGTSGTWFVVGNVTVTGNANDAIRCKLWDGTTVIDSTQVLVAGAAPEADIHLSGILASPAANIRISCRNVTSTTGSNIINNDSLNSKDSTVSGVRIQ